MNSEKLANAVWSQIKDRFHFPAVNSLYKLCGDKLEKADEVEGGYHPSFVINNAVRRLNSRIARIEELRAFTQYMEWPSPEFDAKRAEINQLINQSFEEIRVEEPTVIAA